MRTRSIAAVAATLSLVLAACGGGDDGESTDTTAPTSSETTEAPTESDSTAPAGTDAPIATDAPDDTDAPASPDTWDQGPIGFRLVNISDTTVDIYARTTGLVEAYLALPGVTPGTVTDLVNPPAEGTFVVTEAGADDPECVIDCPHILIELTASEPEGDVRTIILYNVPAGDSFDEEGSLQSFDLWENPSPDRLGNSNSMPAAEAGGALAIVTAISVDDADFGLRLSYEGTGACAESNLAGVLIGGNQTPAFSFAGPTGLQIHANEDQDCTGDPILGPIAMPGEPGTRAHVILTGGTSTGLDALVIPFAGDPAIDTTVETGGGSVDAGDAEAVALAGMMEGVENDIGVPADQSECVAQLMVDAIGAENLVDENGEFVDLDAVGDAFVEPAQEALAESVEVCGLDPALFGG